MMGDNVPPFPEIQNEIYNNNENENNKPTNTQPSSFSLAINSLSLRWPAA